VTGSLAVANQETAGHRAISATLALANIGVEAFWLIGPETGRIRQHNNIRSRRVIGVTIENARRPAYAPAQAIGRLQMAGAVTGDRSPANRQLRSAASYCPKRHGAGISAQGIITARPRRWPLMLMLKPSKAGVESACTGSWSCPTLSMPIACTTMT
jgi:hypothetical protein